MAEEYTPQPNFYAVIPAPVMYDKRLKSSAKLLYAQLSALSNQEGYCWATNEYFATMNEVDDKTISRLISQLVEYGHIEVIIDKIAGNKRKIYIITTSTQKSHEVVTKSSRGSDEIVTTPLASTPSGEKAPNTIYNNITNILSKDSTESAPKTSVDPRVVEGEEMLRQYDASVPKLKQYGNGDVSYLVGYLKEKLHVPMLDGTEQTNRRYCWLAMKKFGGLDKVKMLVDMAMEDNFWSTRIASYQTLYYKGVSIMSSVRDTGRWGVTKV